MIIRRIIFIPVEQYGFSETSHGWINHIHWYIIPHYLQFLIHEVMYQFLSSLLRLRNYYQSGHTRNIILKYYLYPIFSSCQSWFIPPCSLHLE